MNKGILNEIKSNFTRLSNADRRLAEFILENANEIVKMSIGKIAMQANVSDPTVVRFCRSLGFEGFKEFKIKLTQELANNNYYVHRKVKKGDDVSTYIKSIGDFTLNSLSKMLDELDVQTVERMVNLFTKASKIEFWGFGASASVAHDAHHKFFRLGVPCSFNSDPHMQAMSASVISRDALIVAISHTGRSKELIENIRFARETGVKVIGITSKGSPLEEQCDLSIGVELDEDTNVYTPMVSRLAHLLIVDILVVGVSLAGGDEIKDHLKTIKNALVEKKLEKEE